MAVYKYDLRDDLHVALSAEDAEEVRVVLLHAAQLLRQNAPDGGRRPATRRSRRLEQLAARFES